MDNPTLMSSSIHALFNPNQGPKFGDLGLLIMRLGFGLTMALGHGYGKISKYFGAEGDIQWADPIGLGPGLSLLLAGSAEFFCALFIALGFATRLFSIPLAFTMLVAAFIQHGDDPFAKKELALLYLFPFMALIFTGPGKISLDNFISKRLKS